MVTQKLDSMKSMNPVVNAYLASIPDSIAKLFLDVRKTILFAGPDLHEDIKWKNCLTYILDKKNLIQTVVGKQKISLIFHNGAFLKDRSGLLQGDGKRTRTIRITQDDFDSGALIELVTAAIDFESRK